MSRFSRRAFLEQASAASICALTRAANPISAEELVPKEASQSILPASFPGRWAAFGRLAIHRLGDSVTLQDGFAVARESWKDGEFHFRARAPKGIEQVQIWAGLRCLDRDRRYVFALRGGNNDDVYLARYAPDGGIKFLGIAPLDFHPVPDVWYKMRAVVRDNRFQIYVNDESLPRINVVDDGVLWGEGSVSLGGGWLSAEYRDVETHPLTHTDIAAINATGGLESGPLNLEVLTASLSGRNSVPDIEQRASPRSISRGWKYLSTANGCFSPTRNRDFRHGSVCI